MPDTISTDEQEQIHTILERWRKLNSIPLQSLPVFNLVFDMRRYMFVCKLGKEKRELLASSLETAAEHDKQTASHILKYYKHWMLIRVDYDINDELFNDELLRPSQPTQDDTLLRAATYTETTPQDQLLRPVQNQDE